MFIEKVISLARLRPHLAKCTVAGFPEHSERPGSYRLSESDKIVGDHRPRMPVIAFTAAAEGWHRVVSDERDARPGNQMVTGGDDA